MILGTLQKQPREATLARFDYTKFLATGQTVSAVTLDVTTGLTAQLIATLPGKEVAVLISSGIDGGEYLVTLLAEISDGQRVESEIVVNVEEIAL